MYYWHKKLFLIILIGLVSFGQIFAQNAKPKITRLKAEFIKEQNKEEKIVATLKIKEDRYVPLVEAEIHFYNITDSTNILLDKIKTDDDGIASFVLKEDQKLYMDSSGLIRFLIEFNGDSDAKASDTELEYKQSNLEISFYQKDTIKYIGVGFTEFTPDSKINPIPDFNILFFIKGTFSLLNIGEQVTDENGNAAIEFPVHMPGDTAGVLTIVSKIEESDTYGTVIASGDMNWGKVVPLAKEEHRGLGDTDAPLWMVYTLIILLSAVWFHYFYVIFLVVKIKMARKSEENVSMAT